MVTEKGRIAVGPQGRGLKNKKILITAGPTWVPIDGVRVISNIATGETGLFLTAQALRQGAKVTLVLGPSEKALPAVLKKSIRLVRFRFFDEIKKIVRKELAVRDYDFIIHCAAISDFKPARQVKGKIASHRVQHLRLVPLPKIISDIRRLAPAAGLVIFKLEAGITDIALIKRARRSLVSAGALTAVANRLDPYRAYIIDRHKVIARANSKRELARKLIGVLDRVSN